MKLQNQKFSVKIVLSILLIGVLIFFDQWTKVIAYNHLKPVGEIELIPGVLALHYLENTGAAFSFAANSSIFQSIMMVVTPVFCVLVFYLLVVALKASGKFRVLSYTLIFIIAGAIGNYIDRVMRRSVIDFIYFKLIDFPVFNVADIYVTCSIVVLFLLILFYYKDEDFEALKISMKKDSSKDE